MRKCESPLDAKVSEEGGGRSGPGVRERILLQPLEKTVVMQPLEDHSREDTHLQTIEGLIPEQVDVSKVGCDPTESLCSSRLLAGAVACGEEPTQEQGF